MKRSGFTMIELIFVIVILGILAAVAIPRLAATRDDAKISTKIQEATQFLQEMGATYTAKGVFGPIQEMTNVKLSTTVNTDTDAATTDMNNTSTVYLNNGNAISCVSFKTLANGSLDGNVTVTNLGSTDSICRAVEKVLADKNISSTTGIVHTFGGKQVYY